MGDERVARSPTVSRLLDTYPRFRFGAPERGALVFLPFGVAGWPLIQFLLLLSSLPLGLREHLFHGSQRFRTHTKDGVSIGTFLGTKAPYYQQGPFSTAVNHTACYFAHWGQAMVDLQSVVPARRSTCRAEAPACSKSGAGVGVTGSMGRGMPSPRPEARPRAFRKNLASLSQP